MTTNNNLGSDSSIYI